MTQIRQLSKNNPMYIDKHAFYSAYHFALQYPEWKRQYALLIGDAVKAVDYNDMPRGAGVGDPTARIAMRSSILRSNIDLIERTALIAGRDLAEYLLIGVTVEGETYTHLHMAHNMPCGRSKYYQMRRLFYYLLNKALEERGLTS